MRGGDTPCSPTVQCLLANVFPDFGIALVAFLRVRLGGEYR